MIRHVPVLLLFLSGIGVAQVTLHASDNVPKIVSSKPEGTTFIFAPGTYRLSQAIIPKNNDKFLGEKQCAPPESSCPAIITGGVVIGPKARFVAGNYEVANQKQRNQRAANESDCDTGYLGCMYPEDLFFDGKPLLHLDSPTLPSLGPGEWWFDYNNHTIYFHDDPTGHTVETSVVDGAFGGPANHVTIQYLTVEETAGMYPVAAIGQGQGANALTQETDWRVENCEIRLNHGFGVRVGYRIRVLHNYIHDNGETGVGGGIGVESAPETHSTDAQMLIMGNTINHNDYAHFDSQFGSGGIKIGATNGIVIRNNIIEHNEGAGIHLDDDSGDALIDGNTIADNADTDGLVQEIGDGSAIFRNNKVLRNGAQVYGKNSAFQIALRVSPRVEVYCNALEVPPGPGIHAFGIGTSNRGKSQFPPFQYRTAVGNSFHHNTVIWEPGATGEIGIRHNDPQNQPNFFTANTPPDYNSYHLANESAALFVYDNDNSRRNQVKNFRDHRASHADVHSSADTNNSSGFPEVSITSPIDQSSVSGTVTVEAKASDKSGIRKVEFYVDWNLQTTVNDPPYSFSWTNGATGAHIVAAMAYSNAGIRNCYAVTLNQH